MREGAWRVALLLFAGAAAAEEPRPWNLAARFSATHDTNVPLAATETAFSGNRSTNVLGLGLSGDYRLYRQDTWTVAATGGLQRTYNGDPALRDFDLTSVAAGVAAVDTFRLYGKRAALTMNYAARRDWLGSTGFSSGHVASVDFSLRPTFSTSYGAYAIVGVNDFDDDGPQPEFSSRDGVSYRTGIRAVKGFAGNRRSIQANLAYAKYDADGANFVFDGPAGSLQFMSYVFGPWAAAFTASRAYVRYTNYAVEPRRENRITDYRFALYGPLSRQLSVDLSYGRSKYDSNEATFEAKRENISLGVTYVF